jgi:uncharacterized phage infection (PIP) family protein YhgE
MNNQERALSSFAWLDQQRLLFVFVFVIGTLGIVISRELGLGVITAVAFAIGSMAVYIGFGANKKFLLRPDILGDNTYYLGFLFTLVSLAYTLYKYSHETGEVDRIIQNFGIALSTTLVGLVARVYFNRTREEPVLYENAVRMSLAEQAAALIGETAKIRSDVTVLRTSIQQTINEGVESALNELRVNTATILDGYKKELQTNSEEIAFGLRKTLESHGASVLKVIEHQESASLVNLNHSQNFAEAMDSLINSIKTLGAKLADLSTIDAPLKSKLLDPLLSLHTTIKELDEGFLKLSQTSQHSHRSLIDFGDTLKAKLNFDTSDATSALDSLSNTVNSLSTSLEGSVKKLSDSVQSISNAYQAVPTNFSTLNSELEGCTKSLRESVAKSHEMVLEVERSLVKLAQKLVEAVSKE